MLNGQMYYCISTVGNVKEAKWEGSNSDILREQVGNLFLTKEDAEAEVEKRRVVTKLKKFASPFEPYGYGNNFSIVFDCDTESIIIEPVDSVGHTGRLIFRTMQDAQKAIREVGEDNIIQFYLGIEVPEDAY